jgi:hypothetical protein
MRVIPTIHTLKRYAILREASSNLLTILRVKMTPRMKRSRRRLTEKRMKRQKIKPRPSRNFLQVLLRKGLTHHLVGPSIQTL